MIASIHHVCVETDRYEESLAFYRDLLGFRLLRETKGFHGRDFNAWLQAGEAVIELQTPKSRADAGEAGAAGAAAGTGAAEERPGLAHVCLRVADLDEAVGELEAKGFDRFRRKGGLVVYQVEESRLCKLLAPEGTIVELR